MILKLIDPLDKDRKEILLHKSQYVQIKGLLYMQTKMSKCIITCKLNEANQLIDIETNKIVGQILPGSHDDRI